VKKPKRDPAGTVPISLEVSVNGKHVAVMGVQGTGGISMGVSAWRPRSGRASVSMHLGGTDSNDLVWDRFYSWPAPRLRIGDEVRIRVVPPRRADPARFMTKYHRLDARDMPGAENPTFAVVQHVRIWADKADVLLSASHEGNAVRLTPKAARKVATALTRAVRRLAVRARRA
jgi:hypothetical protein